MQGETPHNTQFLKYAQQPQPQQTQSQQPQQSQQSPGALSSSLRSVSSYQPLPSDLKVLTLNYCGIMNNPFEFYSQSLWQQLSEISRIFDKLVQLNFGLQEGAKFEWNMGKVEQKVRLGRFSPSFHANVGIYESGTRFLSVNEFRQRWYAAFDVLTANNSPKYDRAHIDATYNYDVLYFHALLAYVYKKENLQELLQQDPQVYKQTLSKFYDQSFLDEKRKLAKVQATLLKLDFDILFLQEYSPLFESFIAQQPNNFAYITDSSHDTIIVVKRSSFKSIAFIDTVLTPAEKEAMNWNGKTSFLLVDNIILINAHIASNKQKNAEQQASLRQTICALRDSKPQYHIILGGDLNSYLAPDQQLDQRFQLFPREAKVVTTIKQRTKAQGQYGKGNVVSSEGKDKIISSLPILPGSAVTFIDGFTTPSPESFVPTDEHPFDHFLVKAVIRRQ